MKKSKASPLNQMGLEFRKPSISQYYDYFFLLLSIVLLASFNITAPIYIATICNLFIAGCVGINVSSSIINRNNLLRLIESYKYDEIEKSSSINMSIFISRKLQFNIDTQNPCYWEIAKALFLIGVNVDFKDFKGRTPLMHLASRKQTSEEQMRYTKEMIEEHNANIKIQDNNGNTALIYAVMSNNLPMVKALLINKNLYVNIINNFGFNALMIGSKYGASLSVMKYLLDCGANIYTKNNNGESLIEITNKFSNYKFIKLLNEYQENKSNSLEVNKKLPEHQKFWQDATKLESYSNSSLYFNAKEPNNIIKTQNFNDSYLDQYVNKKIPDDDINQKPDKKTSKSERFKNFLQGQQKITDSILQIEQDRLEKLRKNWLIDKTESLLELKQLTKSIIAFLPSELDVSNNIKKIDFKGSSLYKHYLPDCKQNFIPSDIDLELIVPKLTKNQDPEQIKTSICQLLLIKNKDYLQNFKIWRGNPEVASDIKKDIWNIEFVLNKEQTGLSLPVNVIIRNQKHLNPPKKDWVASFDALRMTLYEDNLIKLKECPQIYVCSDLNTSLSDWVTKIKDGKFIINTDNYNHNKIIKYINKGIITVDNDFLPSTSLDLVSFQHCVNENKTATNIK
jgi:ankyrin repeat protein